MNIDNAKAQLEAWTEPKLSTDEIRYWDALFFQQLNLRFRTLTEKINADKGTMASMAGALKNKLRDEYNVIFEELVPLDHPQRPLLYAVYYPALKVIQEQGIARLLLDDEVRKKAHDTTSTLVTPKAREFRELQEKLTADGELTLDVNMVGGLLASCIVTPIEEKALIVLLDLLNMGRDLLMKGQLHRHQIVAVQSLEKALMDLKLFEVPDDQAEEMPTMPDEPLHRQAEDIEFKE